MSVIECRWARAVAVHRRRTCGRSSGREPAQDAEVTRHQGLRAIASIGFMPCPNRAMASRFFFSSL